jgi:peptide/histidine transporter 3/4
VGASEILAAITSLEFFYSQAPISMRSVSQSLNLFTNALGSFLVIPVLLLVNSDSSKTSLLVAGVVVTARYLTLRFANSRTGNEWVPTNLDEGHLDYYFFLLAGLMGLTLVCSLPLLLRSAPAAYI